MTSLRSPSQIQVFSPWGTFSAVWGNFQKHDKKVVVPRHWRNVGIVLDQWHFPAQTETRHILKNKPLTGGLTGVKINPVEVTDCKVCQWLSFDPNLTPSKEEKCMLLSLSLTQGWIHCQVRLKARPFASFTDHREISILIISPILKLVKYHYSPIIP